MNLRRNIILMWIYHVQRKSLTQRVIRVCNYFNRQGRYEGTKGAKETSRVHYKVISQTISGTKRKIKASSTYFYR